MKKTFYDSEWGPKTVQASLNSNALRTWGKIHFCKNRLLWGFENENDATFRILKKKKSIWMHIWRTNAGVNHFCLQTFKNFKIIYKILFFVNR